MSERIHELKTEAPYWDAAAEGLKTFEVRKNDRFFQKGDIVALHRMCEGGGGFYDLTNAGVKKTLRFRIGDILTGGMHGVEPGYVVFSLLPISGGGDE